MLKKLVVVLALLGLAGCGTVGGAVSGAGSDLSKLGDWIKNI
jgi:predicted small secreted protein